MTNPSTEPGRVVAIAVTDLDRNERLPLPGPLVGTVGVLAGGAHRGLGAEPLKSAVAGVTSSVTECTRPSRNPRAKAATRGTARSAK